MANKQTRFLRKQGISTTVIKGANGTGEGGAEKHGALIFVKFDVHRGSACRTAFSEDKDKNPGNRKSARGQRTVRRG